MNDLGFKLTAKNSNGEQELNCCEHGGEFWFTLHGVYKGEHIQIDFDTLTKSEFEDIKVGMELLLEGVKP
jgi:hypothetical protein